MSLTIYGIPASRASRPLWAVTETEADALTVLMHRRVMPAERRKPEPAEPAAAAAAAERRLVVPFKVVEQHLRHQLDRGQDHLAAAQLTVADVCVASVLNGARPASGLMVAHPLTHAWLMRCVHQPGCRAVQALIRP